MAVRRRFRKDPDALLDYEFDWGAWLPPGDTIAAITMTADAGIVVESSTFTDTTATVWLSGGTELEIYTITNHITTADGREEDMTIEIQIRSN
jgi:hypothetical protein